MATEKITRRDLPHWYKPNATHFITFRLAGALPQLYWIELKARNEHFLGGKTIGQATASQREMFHKQVFAAYDEYLDRNRDIHFLDDPRIAALVRRTLYYWSGKKYGLCAYCIMPNHVHVLLRPFDIESASQLERNAWEPGESADKLSPLSSIMHSLKSYSAHEANKLLARTGEFWQHESYDHWVRDEDELERIVAYINANPVKAGLAEHPFEFFWCSAHDRYLQDGDESGWLG